MGILDALVDRRDVTHEREARYDEPHVVTYASPDMVETNHLLNQIREKLNTSITELMITDREPAQFCMKNFPVPGAERYIVRRTGSGGTYSVAQNAPLLIVEANETRLGGTIVNFGISAVTLYLTVDLLEPGTGTPLSAAVPQIGLNANGGTWDFRLGNLLWGGSVVAICTAAGGSVVTVAEL